MVRLLKEAMVSINGVGAGGLGLQLWMMVLLSFFIISAIIFSCAEGATKDRATTTDDHTVYGSAGCSAGCGAGCGG